MSDADFRGLSAGLALLRENKFLESHEVFEDLWRAAQGPQRTFFHGLAQVAASYQQLILARARGSVRTWEKARRKLAAVDALSESFDRAVTELHAALAITVEGPRFVDVDAVAMRLPFPVPDYPPQRPAS